jgi:cleavage and polyadenylation specificity factor subunit 1
MLSDFPDIIRPAGVTREHRHSTDHHNRNTPGPPVTSRPRRLGPERLRIAKSEFEVMLRNGTARRSDSLWASPLHLVPTEEDGWRTCGDYRALNARTVPGQYPVRNNANFAQLAGRKIFSTIDLVKAYHQIPVHPHDIAKKKHHALWGF